MGSLTRDAWLLIVELCDVAAGMDEGTIRDLKGVDRLMLPAEHQGVFLKGETTWAVRDGSAFGR